MKKICCMIAAVMILAAGHALAEPGVCLLDVTPGGFDVLWQADPDGEPSVTVYTDSAGTIEAGDEVVVRAFPLSGGDPLAADAYEAMSAKYAFREKAKALGLYKIRVSGLKPDTGYYFTAAIAYDSGETLTYPETGTRSVKTPKAAGFAANTPILAIQLDDGSGTLDVEGYVASAFCPRTRHGVSAYVGDGAQDDTVSLNLSNVFGEDGVNWTPEGEKELILVILRGTDGPPVWATIAMQFDQEFAVAEAQSLALETTNAGSEIYEAGLSLRVLASNLDQPCACSITDPGQDGVEPKDVLYLLQQAAGY
ncbi:hypothetical protein [Desulfatibacillum aliphaticivorans]|uniref:hypothetical protein n=1 Tax=Desulfatibacillum aliphaticivorans TaxID=218208 RepID=UPI0004073173|nr:hypothetical protein [Desulfatibacillum aliphaticivorans]